MLPPGEQGEIVARGDLVMTGYYKMPDKTAETIIDGLAAHGDLGMLDERGHLFLRDRLREVIISGGFNVYPSDVEVVLSQHPAVAECAIIGIPDDHWGEAVHAAIEAKHNAVVDPDELVSFVKERLGSVKAPKVVHLFNSLPKSAVGKIQKSAVKEQILRAKLSPTAG